MATYATPEEEWHDFLSGTHPHLRDRSPLRFLPSAPRCKLCSAPFGSPGARILRRYGFAPWEKNPKICGRCFKGLQTVSGACPSLGRGEEFGGAEVELSMLFADVRGSSGMARQMPVLDFTRLMNRFYRASTEVLVEGDAIIEKFVGDEVVGLFLPFMTGPDHARKAVETATGLLRATGHGSPDGPWLPIGAGVHTGTAFVGIVTSAEGASDFTALGDAMNIAAHLAAQAGVGEVLVTDDAAGAAMLEPDRLERRHLSLKGYPIDAAVLTTAPAGQP
ncbi:MAG TPA: adenylate/guanylate cyclase domain-containing protein [Actinomycetota bacterium]|nr:adenylate/guanylate cyclase domain-containing protein [Actinomycetota bacterium]